MNRNNAEVTAGISPNRAPVALLDRQGDGARNAAEELQADGAAAIGLAIDVTDRGATESALDTVRSTLGPISIMVTSAGIEFSAPFAQITADAWEKIIAVDLTGTFHSIQAALPDMVTSGWGRIITISSSSAQSGAPDRSSAPRWRATAPPRATSTWICWRE